jgi:predicted phosphodiesterase
MGRSKTVVAIGDCHFPFHDSRVVSRIVELVAEVKPDLVVQMGDVYDALSFSRYPRDVNVATPKSEMYRGRLAAEDMWCRIHRRSPRSKLVQLRGNHDERIEKRVTERLPEFLFLLDLKGLYEFPYVETVYCPQQEFLYDGTLYMHGYLSGLGRHALRNQQNTVCAHTHKGGTVFHRNRRGVYWELNAGWCGNVKAPAFDYRPQRFVRDDTPGVGLVRDGAPSFVPL